MRHCKRIAPRTPIPDCSNGARPSFSSCPPRVRSMRPTRAPQLRCSRALFRRSTRTCASAAAWVRASRSPTCIALPGKLAMRWRSRAESTAQGESACTTSWAHILSCLPVPTPRSSENLRRARWRRCAYTTKNTKPNSNARFGCISASAKTSRPPRNSSTCTATRFSTVCGRSARFAPANWTIRTTNSLFEWQWRSMHSQTKATLSKREVLRLSKERDVRFVRLSFADVLGVAKNVSVPVTVLEAALDGKVTFDGGSIDGFVRGEELDMILQPDASTFAIYPWPGGEARMLCDIAMPDGSPFEGCPRTTLKRAADACSRAIPELAVGIEAEFYLFEARETEYGSTRTSDVGSYFDFSANDRGEEARSAIVSALHTMGVFVASAHHEHGPGQHEIDFPHTGLLEAADALLTLRTIAKHLAAGYGLEATFMPKPLEDRAGNGLHANFRVGEDEKLYAIGGLLRHAPALTAVCNSTVNSYKRLVAAWDAPIYTVWSERSANALVRVPPHEQPPQVEMRSPDPACNPYLALAVLAGALTDGIEQRTLPGDPLVGSTYELTERDRRERGIGTLPKSLRQAIVELDGDPVVRAALGDHVYHAFRDAKLAEYERYRRAVHPWEHRAYLRLY